MRQNHKCMFQSAIPLFRRDLEKTSENTDLTRMFEKETRILLGSAVERTLVSSPLPPPCQETAWELEILLVRRNLEKKHENIIRGKKKREYCIRSALFNTRFVALTSTLPGDDGRPHLHRARRRRGHLRFYSFPRDLGGSKKQEKTLISTWFYETKTRVFVL